MSEEAQFEMVGQTNVRRRKENMLATLQMIKEKYGGAAEYAKKECGQSDEDLAKIRKNMRSEDAPVL